MSEKGRSEFVTCIKDPLSELGSWSVCHERVWGFAFHSIDHAYREMSQNSKLMVCPECLQGIIKMLKKGTGD